MAPKTTQSAPKKASYWKGVKSEFKKIQWPSKENTIHHTVTVIVACLIVAGLIWILDQVFVNLIGLIAR